MAIMDTKYLKRIGAYLFGIIVSLGLVIYAGYQIYRAASQDFSTEAALAENITLTVDANAYLFRDEIALDVPGEGTPLPSLKDAERVGTGGKVADVYTSGDTDITSEIIKLKNIKAELEEFLGGTQSSKDSGKIDSQIYSQLFSSAALAEKGDISSASLAADSLSVSLLKKSVMAGMCSGEDVISSINRRISDAVSELGSIRAEVYAPVSGWYYSHSDGYEEIFTEDAVSSISLTSFREITSASPKPKNADAGRLVLSHKWYFAAELPSKHIKCFEISDKVSIALLKSGNINIDMTVEAVVSSPGEDSFILVLSSGRMGGEINPSRCERISINAYEYSGVSVPTSAIRVVDGIKGVYIFDGVHAWFREAPILTEYNGKYLIDTSLEKRDDQTYPYLAPGDLVITEGRNLFNGRILE